MKYILVLATVVALTANAQTKSELLGAWQKKAGNQVEVITYVPGYFSVVTYNLVDKQFTNTYGGKFVEGKGALTEKIEYDMLHQANVGTERRVTFKIDKGQLILSGGAEGTLTKLDDGGPGMLMGAWVITGRLDGTSLREMKPGARRTVKILSGSRFQWIAYNVETKEVFGTGGGTYTTSDGKYTEQIEFFPKDPSRVGATLAFDYSLTDGKWRHRGKSSSGEPLDEIWTQRAALGM